MLLLSRVSGGGEVPPGLGDLRQIAAARLPRVVLEYLEGGSEDEQTLKANREVFESLRFAPRTLVDVSQRTQKVTLFGKAYDSPFGIAPMGAAGLFWHEGEISLARAARSAHTSTRTTGLYRTTGCSSVIGATITQDMPAFHPWRAFVATLRPSP